eukprot:72484-Rhodomonas_salina.1
MDRRARGWSPQSGNPQLGSGPCNARVGLGLLKCESRHPQTQPPTPKLEPSNPKPEPSNPKLLTQPPNPQP